MLLFFKYSLWILVTNCDGSFKSIKNYKTKFRMKKAQIVQKKLIIRTGRPISSDHFKDHLKHTKIQ